MVIIKKTMILTIFGPSIIVDSIDVFDCAYKLWFCCMLHDVTVDIFLEMLLLERKVF